MLSAESRIAKGGCRRSVPRQIWSGLDGANHIAFIPYSDRQPIPLVITRGSDRRAFSLVELLTVIFIIGLLIAILVPSLSAARNAAKKMTTGKSLDSIKVGLESFKNDNASDFPQTNGYPPSFSHPPIPGYAFKPEDGEFPFLETNPVVTGAHWLPAMLMGPDKLGYLKRSSIPNKGTLRAEPWKWYTPDPLGDGKTTLSRGGPYVDVAIPTKRTEELPGRRNPALFPASNAIEKLPVIVDAFDQAILYYVANAYGRPTNMVEGDRPRLKDNNYTGGAQQEGPPYYFHQDNSAFTGTGVTDPERGWDFGNSGAKHVFAESGAAHTAVDMVPVENGPEPRVSFARHILDRKLYSHYVANPSDVKPTSPLKPVNADSFILISAGVDGRFGTIDDVSNMPPWTE